jgi:hypothetical protein
VVDEIEPGLGLLGIGKCGGRCNFRASRAIVLFRFFYPKESLKMAKIFARAGDILPFPLF